MASSPEQLVRSQVLLREVNERVAEVSGTWAGDPPAFLCECSNEDCVETVELSLDEYKTIRASLNLFVVLPGHECLEVDRVVEARDGFTLVEKTEHTDLVLASHRASLANEG